MKRDHHKMTGQPQPQHHPYPQMGAAGAGRVHSVGGGGVGVYGEGIQSSSTTNPSTAAGKAKIWAEMDDAAGMDDELLAVLGYRVKSSEMADVAQKLEMALGSIETDNAALSQLSGTVHYNPSDISGWLETMLSELNPPSAASETELAAAALSHHQSTAFFDPSTIPSSSSVAGPSQIHHRSLVSDTSDLSNVISSPINQSVAGAASSTIFEEDSSDFDLHAIVAGFHPPQNPIQPPPPPPLLLSPSTDSSNTTTSTITTTPTSKRIKSELITASTSSHPAVSSPPSSLTTGSTTSHPRPRLISTTNTQETGVRLVHTLVACAEAIQSTNLQLADALVKQIGHLALSQSGAMRKVATYFAEALARRIYKIRPHPSLSLIDASTSDQLQSHFYETVPYLKFAHFTANQAILEAFSGAKRVHLIDFSMKQGMQWPALIQALALRPGGPPVMRLTGIGPPQPDGSDALQEVGWKLAHFANTLGVRFHYRGFVCDNLADLEPGMILGGGKVEGGEEEEVVAVNSMFELHRLLARPGEIEKVLGNVRGMKPRIFTVAEQEANHNGSVFLDRFNEALHYYSTMFDSLEGCGGSGGGEDVMVEDGGGGGGVSSRDVAMSEVYLGRQICNVVACEGVERVERHETLAQWRGRLELAGFDPVSLGSNAFKQVSMLLSLFAGGDGYKVEEHNGCLTLGWHSRPLIATSAWQFGGR